MISVSATEPTGSQSPLRIGFIPLTDAAPVIVAHEQGLFRQHGLQVELSREVGWATIRDKVIFRELDASHAPAAMLFGTLLGTGTVPCDCVTGFVMNLNGNAITLSESLWNKGVRDVHGLKDEIVRSRGKHRYVFGTVFPESSHGILLHDWLKSGDIDPQRDVKIVVVPPAQMFRNLIAGTIDGFCVGEPWNSLAVREKAGWCPAISPRLAPLHPEKVLMVRKDFAEQNSGEHVAMIAALRESAALCDDPTFRPELVKLLARREYLNVPERVLSAALVGPFDLGHDQKEEGSTMIVYSREDANRPTAARAAWVINGLKRAGLLGTVSIDVPALCARAFREDIFNQATTTKKHNHEAVVIG